MKASLRVRLTTDNVAGVHLPVFTPVSVPRESQESLGLAGGGKAIVRCQAKFTDLARLLIRIASLQTSFKSLDEAIKLTNRRVNALDNVVLPKLIATIAYIDSELSEIEREEIFRCVLSFGCVTHPLPLTGLLHCAPRSIKKVLEVKRRREVVEAQERQDAKDSYAERMGTSADAGPAAGAGDGPSLLDDPEEDDLIF